MKKLLTQIYLPKFQSRTAKKNSLGVAAMRGWLVKIAFKMIAVLEDNLST